MVIVQWGGYDIENLPTPGHIKMGIMVTVSPFRVPFSDIEHPFLLSPHHIEHSDFLFCPIICLPPFIMCPSSRSLLYMTPCWMLGMKWGYSDSRSWIPSQRWYWKSWSDRCNVLCFLEQTVTFQLISEPAYDIIRNLSGGCVVGARLQTISAYHMLRARLELSLIHIWRCRRSTLCRSRWSPYH